MPKRIAIWNPARDVWEDEKGGTSLFCGHSDVFSGTFPGSGMTRNGVAYELRTWERRMGDTGSSSSPADETDALLRTPCAAKDEGGPLHSDVARECGQTLRLTGQILAMTGDLLPTPMVGSTNPAAHGQISGDFRRRMDEALQDMPAANPELMPTASTEGSNHVDSPEGGPGEVVCRVWGAAYPQEVCERSPRGQGRVSAEDSLLATVREHEVHRDEERAPQPGAEAPGGDVRGMRDGQCFACASQGPQPIERCSGESGDPMRIVPPQAPLAGGPRKASRGDTKWGRFAPAIRRWESVLGHDAPTPTVPSTRDGRGRLNPAFCEWMMGLPPGWVTDPGIGLTRSQQLKALGNGVVPQQGAAAIADMLDAFERTPKEATP